MGFALNAQSGETLSLYNTPVAGGGLLDSVEFGMQLADLSIGRSGHDGAWTLTQPTFGATNVAAPTGNQSELRINEWLASDDGSFGDDFIELVNLDPLPVALGGLFLTDNPVGQPDKHQIAPLSFIAGNGYAVFRADDNSGANHVGFKLAADQELLGLMTPSLAQIDKVIYYGQTTGISEGHRPDGGGTIDWIDPPTPGAPNPGSAAPSADFDGSTVIDGSDFLAWQRGFGTIDATKADGDADNDQDVDGDDLAVWENQYGSPAPLAASSAFSTSEPVSESTHAVEGNGSVINEDEVSRIGGLRASGNKATTQERQLK
ncbi:MAG: hypothetical protein IH898_10630 [Planctomycetes bacterium]|nr:hypothetical protein [Planctomycetota bacterium]